MIISSLGNQWYHATPTVINGCLKCNYQGIHLAQSAHGALSVTSNRNIASARLYSVSVLAEELHPLYIEYDPMDWSASTVIELLCNYYNDLTVAGAYGEPDDEGCQWKDVIRARDLLQLELSDETYDYLLSLNSKASTFAQLGKFLESLGYNCIVYPLAEDDLQSNAMLLWDNTHIKQLKQITIL